MAKEEGCAEAASPPRAVDEVAAKGRTVRKRLHWLSLIDRWYAYNGCGRQLDLNPHPSVDANVSDDMRTPGSIDANVVVSVRRRLVGFSIRQRVLRTFHVFERPSDRVQCIHRTDNLVADYSKRPPMAQRLEIVYAYHRVI